MACVIPLNFTALCRGGVISSGFPFQIPSAHTRPGTPGRRIRLLRRRVSPAVDVLMCWGMRAGVVVTVRVPNSEVPAVSFPFFLGWGFEAGPPLPWQLKSHVLGFRVSL